MNKHVLVTGGTRGIGLAIVKAFAASGFDVSFNGRETSKAQAIAQQLQKEYSDVTIHGYGADLSTKEGCEKLHQAISTNGCTLDVLVNNAGYFVPGSVLAEPDGALEQQMAANVYSAYYTTRLFASDLIHSKGHIFNMCSIASITAYSNGGAYCMSKFALLGFSKVLRESLKPNAVRVTAVLPGATYTDSWAGSDLPIERLMAAEDIAAAILACYQMSNRTVVEELIIRPQLGDI